MGLLANLRFGLQRTRHGGSRPCSHLDQIHEVTPSSTGSRHAHQHAPTHQIVRSMQPGEDWLWCYTDRALVQPPPGGPAR